MITCNAYPAELKVFLNHVYEYKKGVRNMVLYTTNKKYEEFAVSRLNSQNIDYCIQPIGCNKINLFFGRRECIEVIQSMTSRPLNELTPEEDFILGAIRMHIHFLMRMLAEIIARHVARDEHERDGIERRIGNAGYGVGDAGAKVRKDNGGLMLYAGIAVRRGCGDLLMAHGDILDLLAAGERIQKADDGMSAKAEDVFYAAAFQVIYH